MTGAVGSCRYRALHRRPDLARGRRGLRADRPVIVPVGAVAKEHGHHLPMKTDWLLARALAEGIAARLPVLIAPIVPFGYYPVFQNYPGSQHLSADTFVRLLTELLERLLDQGARRLAILNTGVSTEGPIGLVTRGILERRGLKIGVADIRRLGRKADHLLKQQFGGHADERETSILLAIAPELVRMDLARVGLRQGAAAGHFRDADHHAKHRCRCRRLQRDRCVRRSDARERREGSHLSRCHDRGFGRRIDRDVSGSATGAMTRAHRHHKRSAFLFWRR